MSLPQEVPGVDNAQPGLEATAGRRCPLCCEQIHPEARRCRHCKSWLDGRPWQGEWYRGGEGTRIAGVCAGLANQFGLHPTPVRILFVLATVFGGGIGPVLYAVLWFIMPHVSRKTTARSK